MFSSFDRKIRIGRCCSVISFYPLDLRHGRSASIIAKARGKTREEKRNKCHGFKGSSCHSNCNLHGVLTRDFPRQNATVCACTRGHTLDPLYTPFTNARYVLCLYPAPMSIEMKAPTRPPRAYPFCEFPLRPDPYSDRRVCNCRESERGWSIMGRLRNAPRLITRRAGVAIHER